MAARTKKKTAGFWDTYEDTGGGKYLTAPEKAALIDNEIVLEITGVKFDEKNQYQGQPAPRYVVTFMVEGVERFAGFAISDDGESSRDRLLGALVEYLEGGATDPVLVVMERQGQFVKLVKADA